mmetsp:Transcript_9544/g.27151  ORF Transcript_9544/g.27151 Transcript_9544/m.27151 type:complete len:246 (+) Transcript_9544:500-1237(+)
MGVPETKKDPLAVQEVHKELAGLKGEVLRYLQLVGPGILHGTRELRFEELARPRKKVLVARDPVRNPLSYDQTIVMIVTWSSGVLLFFLKAVIFIHAAIGFLRRGRVHPPQEIYLPLLVELQRAYDHLGVRRHHQRPESDVRDHFHSHLTSSLLIVKLQLRAAGDDQLPVLPQKIQETRHSGPWARPRHVYPIVQPSLRIRKKDVVLFERHLAGGESKLWAVCLDGGKVFLRYCKSIVIDFDSHD